MASDTRLLKPAGESVHTRVTKFPGGYAAGGWLIGLLIMGLCAAAIVWLIPTLDPQVLDLETLTSILVGLAWWLGPISLGILSFFWIVARNGRRRRPLRMLGALLVWAALIGVPYLAYLEQGVVDLVPTVMTAVLVVLLSAVGIYIAFRLFSWSSSTTNPRTFLFRFAIFAFIVGTLIWSQLDPAVLNLLLIGGRFALQFLFIIGLAIIQFVAIFWFMSRTKVEAIRPGDPKQVTFADYKGQPNLLRLVQQWIRLLSDRGQFTQMGGRFINGILLYGPPGTGKTLLAKCMAGEAGVAFLSIEGSGFRAMFWGVDVLRMIWFVSKARNLAREYGACFVPATRLYTPGGLKRIADIQVGDMVLSHTGRWRPVTQTMVRDVDEEIYEVRVMNRREPVRVTGEHPLLVVRAGGRPDTVRRGLEHSPDVVARPTWVRVCDLREGDFVAFPRPRVETGSNGYHGELATEVLTDPNVARLIGYWLAEGWVDVYQGGYKIEMAFGAHESAYLDDVAGIAQHLGHATWRRQDRSVTRILFSDATLARFLLQHFGSGAEGKHLPEFVLSMPQTWREQLVQGWIRGDGTHAPARRAWLVATVSEELGHQAIRLFHSLGMSPRLSYRDNRHKRARFPDGREYAMRDLWEVIITGRDYDALCEMLGSSGRAGNRSWTASWMDESYVYHPIKSIQRVHYSGSVHNLEVFEDHSYCAPLIAAHNCIAYIDEIDAVGMSRGGVMGGQGQQGVGMGGGSPFMGGTGALTRLLYEMDGIGEQTRWEKFAAKVFQLLQRPAPARNWHVLFMGSTNRPDVLDPALVRPGRFDQIIQIDRPDQAGRRDIIKYYLDKIQTDDTIDVEDIVADTIRATPATIMSAITKTAVRIAMASGRTKVSQRDIELAFQEQFFGLENPIEEMEENQRQQIAYHEAGHAVAQHYLMPEERIAHVTVKRRGDALGYVMPVPNFEVYAQPLQRYMRDIMVSMAGHVATKLFLGEYWTGATGDFVTVRSNLARLAHYGYFGPPVKDPMLLGLDKVDSAPYERVWRELEDQTERLLRAHAAEVEAVAQILLEKGDMSGRECEEIIRAAASRNGRELEQPADIMALPGQIVDEAVPSNGEREPAPAAEPVPEEVRKDGPAG